MFESKESQLDLFHKPQREYTVFWVIGVTATSPEDAASQAQAELHSAESCATHFHVYEAEEVKPPNGYKLVRASAIG